MAEQYALEQRRQHCLEKVSEHRPRVPTSKLAPMSPMSPMSPLAMSPNASPQMARARTSNSLLPSGLQRTVAQTTSSKQDFKGRRIAAKKKDEIKEKQNSAGLWFLNEKESIQQKSLSEHELENTIDKLRLSSRSFTQTCVNWRTAEDLADLMGNHNSCMRAVTRAKTSSGCRTALEASSPTMSTTLGRMRDREHVDPQLTKQAQKIR